MAKAEVKRGEPVRPAVESVTLELSEQEANTLLAISTRIAGQPSPRAHTDSISNALKAALGYTAWTTREYELCDGRGVDFRSYAEGEFKRG